MRGSSAALFVAFLIVIVLAWVGYAMRHGVYQPYSAPEPPSTQATSTTAAAKNTSGSIEITSPEPNIQVTSPLAIAGKAEGLWFFEGQFQILLLETNGTVLGTTTAHSALEWTAPNFVPFTASLHFAMPTTTPTGLLIFKKDNPSGDPERDLIFAIPVRFR